MTTPWSARIPVRGPGAAWHRIDGEMVILDQDGERLLGLNPLGGMVWDLIDGSRSIAEISRQVGEPFPDLDVGQCAKDVEQFVAELDRLSLVTWREDEASR